MQTASAILTSKFLVKSVCFHLPGHYWLALFLRLISQSKPKASYERFIAQTSLVTVAVF